MAARKHYHSAYLIGESASVTRPAFYALKALNKLVVRHYKVSERDVRDIERASGDVNPVLGPFKLTSESQPWAVHIQLVGYDEEAMIKIVLGEVERAESAGRDLRPYFMHGADGRKQVNDTVRKNGLIYRKKT